MMKILGILLPVMGIGFLSYWFYLTRKCTVRVSGTIVNVEMNGKPKTRSHVSFHPTCRYKVEHCWYTQKAQGEIPYWFTFPKYKAGDTIELLVNKSNPKFYIPADYANIKKGPYIFLLGTVSFIIGLLVAIFM